MQVIRWTGEITMLATALNDRDSNVRRCVANVVIEATGPLPELATLSGRIARDIF